MASFVNPSPTITSYEAIETNFRNWRYRDGYHDRYAHIPMSAGRICVGFVGNFPEGTDKKQTAKVEGMITPLTAQIRLSEIRSDETGKQLNLSGLIFANPDISEISIPQGTNFYIEAVTTPDEDFTLDIVTAAGAVRLGADSELQARAFFNASLAGLMPKTQE